MRNEAKCHKNIFLLSSCGTLYFPIVHGGVEQVTDYFILISLLSSRHLVYCYTIRTHKGYSVDVLVT